MRIAMTEKWRLHRYRRSTRLLAQPPGYQSCSNYRYIVASEGLEPPPTEPKSVVRPTHREAELSELSYVEAYAL